MTAATCPPANTVDAGDPAVDLARECLYRLLATVLAGPRSPAGDLLDDAGLELGQAAADLLREAAEEQTGAAGKLGFAELPAADLDAAPLAEGLRQVGASLTEEHIRVFGLVPAPECPPYETEFYPTAEPFFRAQQMADVAGFYRAFGLGTSRQSPERPDHLALELEFMAHLLRMKRQAREAGGPDADERVAVCAQAEADFFRDHLAWWAASYASGLRRRAGYGPYEAAARLLAAFLPAERARLGVPPPPPPRVSLAIVGPRSNEADGPADGADGADGAAEEPGCNGCASS